jgi:hypothetical protein
MTELSRAPSTDVEGLSHLQLQSEEGEEMSEEEDGLSSGGEGVTRQSTEAQLSSSLSHAPPIFPVRSASDTSIDEAMPDEPFPGYKKCNGVALDWQIGPILSHYPFLRHLRNDDLQFHISGIEDHGTTLRVTRFDCLKKFKAKPGVESCSACAGINTSPKVESMRRIAWDPQPHTNYDYLSPHQLKDKIEHYSSQLNLHKLKVSHIMVLIVIFTSSWSHRL